MFESELLEKRKELADIANKVAEAKQALAHSEEDKRGGAILEISGALDDARSKRADALRKASRLEGQIEAMERTMSNASIPLGEVSRLVEEGERALSGFSNTPIQEVLSFFREYFSRFKALTAQTAEDSNDVALLKRERELAVNTEKECIQRETELGESLEKIRTELDSARTNEREKERALFSLATAEREVRHRINILEGEIGRLGLEKAEFERDLLEAGTLIGREVLLYPDADVSLLASRDEQVEEKRQLEKTKIRLEEMGTGASADVLKEHKEVSEREAFLEHELADLSAASVSLKGLIQNLEAELSVRFKEGIDAINSEFTKLFALMFDGGSASLVRVEEPVRKAKSNFDEDATEEVTEESEETSAGIDISLSIPRKRVKSLVMLSGGERTLTSIALIFAMSSVNPPPFLILDETDAALDESNSRRYGDMVEALSKKSQLAIITHNRETMSRAGILYGITMGNDGVSKVLSVKLEEAVKVAK